MIRQSLSILALCCVGLSAAQNTGLKLGVPVGIDTPRPELVGPPPPQLAAETIVPHYVEPFETLLNLRVLDDLTHVSGSAARVVLKSTEKERLLEVLRQVQNASGVSGVANESAALVNALESSTRQHLQEGRAQLERRAHMILLSSRVVRGENMPVVADIRLSFMVPGGQSTIAAVRRTPLDNPFRTGIPAALLNRLIVRLSR
ncbi:hypothetical protein [uncultured Deinococcus sp.]|uniref:hypothetical protein n=1 Tax=uncultured Deinococcus sp. TaxID=158789 RepID=UPI0025E0C36B|nr:hypothetical protein [uncultured Deinococcus sp.]